MPGWPIIAGIFSVLTTLEEPPRIHACKAQSFQLFQQSLQRGLGNFVGCLFAHSEFLPDLLIAPAFPDPFYHNPRPLWQGGNDLF